LYKKLSTLKPYTFTNFAKRLLTVASKREKYEPDSELRCELFLSHLKLIDLLIECNRPTVIDTKKSLKETRSNFVQEL
jgi:hypothetical protein